MRRNIKNKKTKKKVLHGGAKGGATSGVGLRRRNMEPCKNAADSWTAWYDKYIISQCDFADDDGAHTSFYNTFHRGASTKMKVNYNKYNRPLLEKTAGGRVVEYAPVSLWERHEWHKLIANNNEIRDFAILKLLFQLTKNQKEIISNQDKNTKNWTTLFDMVDKLLTSKDREPTNPTKDTDPNK